MKKILILLFSLFFVVTSFGQYTITQNLGSGNTLVRVPPNGGLQGSLINRNFSDTTAANLTPIKFYSGSMVYTTGDSSFWIRNWLSDRWQKIAVGGGGTDTVIVNGDFWGVHGNEFIGVDLAEPSIGVVSSPGDAFGMWFLANGVRSLYFPPNGLSLLNDTTNTKVMTFNPTTKNWGYANWLGSGGSGSVSANNGLVLNSGGVVGLDSNGINPLSRNMRINLNGNTGAFTGGNVGIGITSPAFKLDVGGTSSVTDRKIGINGVQVFYLPDQATFTGSLFSGYHAGDSLTSAGGFTGQYNTAIGYNSYANATTGYFNTAYGANTLFNNKTGTENTAIGTSSMYQNTTGDFNTAVGTSALQNNTTGQTNVAIGDQSMRENTTGKQNSAGGYRVMQLNNGDFNSGWGYRWGESMTTAHGNSGIGNTALGKTTTGGFNYAGGFFAGYQNTTGSYNTFLGSNAGESSSQASNLNSSVAIGAGSYTTASYQLSFSDSINRLTAVGLSKGVANYVLTDSLGNGQYWVARPNAALSLGLQDVITNNPVLASTPNAITGTEPLSFSITSGGKTGQLSVDAGAVTNTSSSTAATSSFQVKTDTIWNRPHLGNYFIDTLNSSANATDSMVVWNKANGNVGIRAIPSGGGGVTTLAAIGSSANANGATISGSTLNLEPASASFGGVVTTGTQTFAGAKTFNSNATINGLITGTYGGDQGFQVTNSKSLYFVTNGTLLNFEAGSAKLQVQIAGAGAYTQGSLVYGGNTGYWRMGSNMQFVGSAGYTSLGAAGTVDLLKVSTTAITADLPVVLKAYTVATLPTGVVGMTAYVSDALAPAYLTPVVGGGAIKTPVFYDGTNWVAH